MHVHRESSALANELPEESGQFRFLRAAGLANLKGSVRLILAKASAMLGFLYRSICLLGLSYHYRVSFVLVVKHHFYPPPSSLSLRILPEQHMLGFSFTVLSAFVLIIVLS